MSMKARSRHLGRSRARALVDAAYALAGEHGLDELSARAIEASIGLSHGSLRHHLGPMERVREAVRGRHGDAMTEALAESVDQARSCDSVGHALQVLRRAVLDGPSDLPDPAQHLRLVQAFGAEMPWILLLDHWLALTLAPWSEGNAYDTARLIAWSWRTLLFSWLDSGMTSGVTREHVEQLFDTSAMALVFRKRRDRNG